MQAARLTNDSPPNGRPVQVGNRRSSIPPGAGPLVVPWLSPQTSTNRVPQDLANSR